jgi:hypothetical protein
MPIVKYKTMKYTYLLILFLLSSTIFALNSEFNINGKSGWNEIEIWKNIEKYQGKGGYNSLGLMSSIYYADETTDLLIHFDELNVVDSSGNYAVESNISNTQKEKIIGQGSGAFRGKEDSLTLYPGSGSIFAGGQILDSFSIEFWLNPSVFSERPVIISYQGTMQDSQGEYIPQKLTCIMEDRRLDWNFENFFYMDGKENTVELSGISPVLPGFWHHHLLRFNGETGIIEYLVDGKIEAIQYASETRSEDGTLYYPLISPSGKANLTLGWNFTGHMDEVRITRKFTKNPVISQFQGIKGSFISKTLELGRSYSILHKINVKHEIPKDSAIFFYYNISNNIVDMFDETKWREFTPGELLFHNNAGRYLQVKMELETNGDEDLTPVISDIQIVYEENLQPLSPAGFHIEQGDKRVTLSWSNISEPDIKGYIIYYGTNKGNYFGTDALEGASPLIIEGKKNTSITLNDLKNGELYHFAVAAYDSAGIEYPGKLSGEITSRPALRKDY